jgi:hypothetical protein
VDSRVAWCDKEARICTCIQNCGATMCGDSLFVEFTCLTGPTKDSVVYKLVVSTPYKVLGWLLKQRRSLIRLCCFDATRNPVFFCRFVSHLCPFLQDKALDPHYFISALSPITHRKV